MARPRATLLLALAAVCLAACGRKGPLELPSGRAPMPTADLAAAVEGGEVVLSWTNPTKTLAGRPLRELAAVEIWVFEAGLPAAGAVPAAAEVERTARAAAKVPAAAPGLRMSYRFAPSAAPAGARRLAFTVRIAGPGGRLSEFAAPAFATVGGRP
ncbi:MAG: lipoprotein [Candidatus Aminicenantes bacterium]|nr:lipoprotein [Candidatus Aminicenantes bacterium]